MCVTDNIVPFYSESGWSYFVVRVTEIGLFPFSVFILKSWYMSAFGLRAQACVNPALCDPCKRFDPSEQELTMTNQPLPLCVKFRKITI